MRDPGGRSYDRPRVTLHQPPSPLSNWQPGSPPPSPGRQMSSREATRDAGSAGSTRTDACPSRNLAARTALAIAPTDREQLQRWLRAPTTPQRLARRARIILFLADGHADGDVAQVMATTTRTVFRWRKRFEEAGSAGLEHDAPGRGRRPMPGDHYKAPLARVLADTPPNGQRWTIRDLALALGWSRGAVHRRLHRTGLSGRTMAHPNCRDSGRDRAPDPPPP